jgi:hypothetical protein
MLVAGCTAPAEPGRYSGTLVTQDRHVVEDGQTLVGSTVVVGGAVELEEGTEHRGSLTVLAGEVRIGGLVVGDLTVLGGRAVLEGTAEVTGDVVVAGGGLARDADAVVGGTLSEESNASVVLAAPERAARDPVERMLWSLAGVAAMAGLAWLVGRLAPRPLRRTQAAATGFPVVSGALGALVLVTLLPLLASMVFTLFLIPVAVIVLVGMGLAATHGLLALGRGLGMRLVGLLGRSWPMARVAALFLTGFGLRPYVPPPEEGDRSGPPAAGTG